jgi:FtsH-binding integral membrane protein
MNEFYWITRLDSIDKLLFAFSVISLLAFFACLIAYGVTFDDDYYSNNESTAKVRKYFKKGLTTSIIVLIVTSCINTFLPSTKDAYIIYGVGGTFDYLKTNETAKQLPDKVVMAIDSYLNSKIEEQTDSVN